MKIKTNRPCKATMDVIRQISQYPSWKNEIASERLIWRVQDALQGCIEMLITTALKNAGKKPLNWLKYEIDITKIRLGAVHYDRYVRPLYRKTYEKYLPKLGEDLEGNVIEIPNEAFKVRKFGWWKAYFSDEPDFIQELKQDYLKYKEPP